MGAVASGRGTQPVPEGCDRGTWESRCSIYSHPPLSYCLPLAKLKGQPVGKGGWAMPSLVASLLPVGESREIKEFPLVLE